MAAARGTAASVAKKKKNVILTKHSARNLVDQQDEGRKTQSDPLQGQIIYRQLQRVSGFVRFPLCSLVTNELDFSIISLGENFGQVWILVSVTRRQLHAVARDDDSHDRALRLGASSRRRSTGLSQAHVRASRPCRERMRCVPSHTSSFRCFCHLCRR